MDHELVVMEDPRRDEIYYFKTHYISRLTAQILFNHWDSVENEAPNYLYVDYRRKISANRKHTPKFYSPSFGPDEKPEKEDFEPIEQITANGKVSCKIFNKKIIVNIY